MRDRPLAGASWAEATRSVAPVPGSDRPSQAEEATTATAMAASLTPQVRTDVPSRGMVVPPPFELPAVQRTATGDGPHEQN
jgi:hypothetical protein